jgi:hypothetical protein
MADATYEVKEVRVKIEPELTQVYIYCGPPSDGMLGVQGWHHKTFPASRNMMDILSDAFTGKDHYLLWGIEAPN